MRSLKPRIRQEKTLFSEKCIPVLIFILLLITTFLLVLYISPQYGQSWDDEYDADTGRTALNAYLGYRSYIDTHDQRYYGPFFFLISELGVRTLQTFDPSLHPVDIRHAFNFTSFILSLPAFFLLSRFLFSSQVSIYLTVLFGTQPLLFGHAYINQKDIPLMTLTLWTFYLGIQAFDKSATDSQWRLKSESTPWADRLTRLRNSWIELSLFKRAFLASVVILSTLLILDLLLQLITFSLMTKLIGNMYAGQAWEPLQSLFDRVATDSYKTPLSLYIDRAFRVYLWLRIPFILLILWIDIAIIRKCSYSLKVRVREGWIQSRPIILAGVILGLATTFRAPAIFIGALVCIYAIYMKGRRAWILLVLYAASAYISLYVSWPFMWESTLTNFIESLQIISDFTAHTVLYRGEILSSDNLPWHYIPTLLGIQLTEPVPALAIVGVVFLVLGKKTPRQKIIGLLVFAWIALPSVFILVLKTPLYGNFRQILFLLPPLFILCGFLLSEIEARLRRNWFKASLAAALLLPGILGIALLHPYEYTYYNQLVGGPGNVNGVYELDYWCTGYREAARYLNEHAPYSAKIVVAGPEYGVRNFIRSDLQVFPDFVEIQEPFYSVACERTLVTGFHKELNIIYEIAREGAVYSVIRAPN
jgi:hypothetical protein